MGVLVSRDGMNECWHFSGSFLALKRQNKNVAAMSNLNIIFTVIPEEEWNYKENYDLPGAWGCETLSSIKFYAAQ